MLRKLSIVLFFIGCLSIITYAQKYSYKRYTVDDGLPTNAVYGGMQDSRGYIWFYTEKGIARFDGYEFKTYTKQDGLPTNDIFYITEDQYGRFWLSSFAPKLVIMDVERDTFITASRSNEGLNIRYLILTDGENVWSKILNSKIHDVYISNNNFFSVNVFSTRSSLIDAKNATNSNTFYCSPSSSIAFPYNSDLAYLLDFSTSNVDSFSIKGLNSRDIHKLQNAYSASHHIYNGNIYVRGPEDSLVYVINPLNRSASSLNIKEYFNGIPNFVTFYLSDNCLQIQTDLGLLIVNQNNQVIDVFSPQLSKDTPVDRIFKDREGNIWVTSRHEGVYMLSADERNASIVNMPENADEKIHCIFLSDSILYFGSKQGNLLETYRSNANPQLINRAKNARYNNNTVVNSISGGNKFLWFARQGDGIYRLDKNTRETISLKKMIKNNSTIVGLTSGSMRYGIDDLCKDLIWLEDEKELLTARGQNPYRCQFFEDSISIQPFTRERTYAITSDSTDVVWLGHNTGLGSFKNDVYTFHDEIELFNGKTIWDLEVSSDNTLWAGTDGDGLVAYNGQHAYTIFGTEKDIVQDVFISADGYIWVATNFGVKQIEHKLPLEESKVINVYDVNSGLITREANCVAVDSQHIFVGTNEGLTRINRNRMYYDSTAPRLYFDQMLVNGQEVEKDSVFHFTYEQNELEFFFTALSFKSFGDIQYEYQLEGADRTINATTNRSVRYSNLTPGTYTFKLIATDVQGIRSLPLKPLIIHIRPPWWETKLFYLLVVLAIALIVLSIYLWRVRVIKKQAEWETMINKQFAELELQALQAQMNPHFVFNSLGAIQYFIQSNRKELADDYLARFGHLMRLFLESSKNKFINLSDEIKLINLYIQLEQIRFKNSFDYQLKIDEDIHTHSTLVPSMLLQPFVENAINHGLFHKEEKGLLSIMFHQNEDDSLSCIIEDNGIGRERAGEIKSQSKKNYKSRATQITEERLDALRKFENYNIGFEIEDLYDEQQEARGTRVTIHIPEID
ncbi:MAG: histidine kinase [Chitinophagales bacterium]|nr:histidine kinase [Chitinophagales bacterium]